MPLKLSVGVSRKVGQPGYGSLGASCGVETVLADTPSGGANLGSTAIAHPFHPRRGQACLVLEAMRTGRDELLVVRTPDGVTLFVPVECMDPARPSPGAAASGAAARLEALCCSRSLRWSCGSAAADHGVDKS